MNWKIVFYSETLYPTISPPMASRLPWELCGLCSFPPCSFTSFTHNKRIFSHCSIFCRRQCYSQNPAYTIHVLIRCSRKPLEFLKNFPSYWNIWPEGSSEQSAINEDEHVDHDCSSKHSISWYHRQCQQSNRVSLSIRGVIRVCIQYYFQAQVKVKVQVQVRGERIWGSGSSESEAENHRLLCFKGKCFQTD